MHVAVAYVRRGAGEKGGGSGGGGVLEGRAAKGGRVARKWATSTGRSLRSWTARVVGCAGQKKRCGTKQHGSAHSRQAEESESRAVRSRNLTSVGRSWYGRAEGVIAQRGQSQGGGGLTQEPVEAERYICVGDAD